MRSSDLVLPVRMSRVAIVAPRARLREALVRLAAAGSVELVGTLPAAEGEEAEALRRLDHARPDAREEEPRVLRDPAGVAELERGGARGLLAGEVELQRRAALAQVYGSFAALVGWTPTPGLRQLEEQLADVGAAAVELPRPSWVDPPTLFAATRVKQPLRPLVTTYGVEPYADVDPTLFAGVAFVLMFSIMFGDVGHGLLLALLGLLLRRVKRGRLRPFQQVWPLPVAAGLGGAVFGLLYGEAFGPTGLVPRLWLDPVDDPVPLLVFALAVGATLLASSHAYGIVNRFREAGLGAALLAPSGAAGLAVLLGAAAAAAGWFAHVSSLVWLGGALSSAGAVLLAVGFLAAAGGGAAGITEAAVELVDALVRIGSNALSFTRLAAFGVMHAALGLIVFAGARDVWGGVAGSLAAVLIFVSGNVVAFSLELLVTGVQALRLEFYELFSRIFSGEGHPFSPWSLPIVSRTEES